MVLQLPVKERQARTKDAVLGARCLRPSHLTRSCYARCRICQGRHHQLNYYGDRDIDQTVEKNVDIYSSDNFNSIRATEVSQVNIVPTSQTKCTLLQTVRVLVAGTKGAIEARLLLDNGSDRSNISSLLLQRLNLKRQSSINLIYSAYGGGRSSNHTRGVYEIKAKEAFGGNDNVETFTVIEFPTTCICTPIQRLSWSSYVLDITFADNFYSNKKDG